MGVLKPLKASADRGKHKVAPAPRGGATILTLTASSCRWPVGNPHEAHFHFCGVQRPPRQTYCSQHARLAYQAQRFRRSDSPRERNESSSSRATRDV